MNLDETIYLISTEQRIKHMSRLKLRQINFENFTELVVKFVLKSLEPLGKANSVVPFGLINVYNGVAI